MAETRDRIDEALGELRSLIRVAVREEQLRDQLTGLSNDLALTDSLTNAIADGTSFWCAFVEVDHFKRINSKFGYETADALLIAIAEQLEAARKFFPEQTTAYRAHGDEFYLLGQTDTDTPASGEMEKSLHQLRTSIGSVRIRVRDVESPMACTVSIGWTWFSVATAQGEGERTIRLNLESAVREAKRKGRNTVVRYDPDLDKQELFEFRDGCECGASFSFDVEAGASRHAEDAWCPNCGKRIPRSPVEEGTPRSAIRLGAPVDS